jgi:OOP family OmpA-OmpF porin
MYRRVAISLSLLGAIACSTTPEVAPLGAGPITPGSGERVVVDHSYLVVDSSSSVETDFATEKAMVQSFVGAMPDGTYQSGAVAFGGYDRQGRSIDGFDRSALRNTADDLEYLSEGTPIDRVLGEVGDELSGKSGKAAVVIFSDGEPTDPVGRDLPEQQVLDAAKAMAGQYAGEVCIHTVQVGDSPEGAAFLKKLANTTSCGSSRSLGTIQNVAALQNFEREVFLGSAPAAVAAAPGDEDQDGVLDADDRCPGTPRGAKVDARGCWHIPNLNFAFDSAKIESQYQGELNDLAGVLKNNPNVAIRIDGHTDSVGADGYNEGLSKRRADSVRSYLVNSGIDASRLSTQGFGEAKPAYPNDTQENRRGNRRTELVTQ